MPRKKKKTILLIEDEQILSEMYKDKFTRSGYDVIIAFDSREGFKLAKDKNPDLIVLDILLPRENGITFLQWQKNDPKIASIPVIVFSNYDDPETRKSAEKMNAREYLIKANYTPEDLLKKIKAYLE